MPVEPTQRFPAPPAPTPPTGSDVDLLTAYAARQDESAFAELVRRYYGLVQSSAERRTGDPALAEDVAQATFILLARKASALSASTPLAGWLFRVVGYAAQNAMRMERRRQRHERRAAEQRAPAPTGDDAARAWDAIRPRLDSALDRLSQNDRDAVVTRYLIGLTLPATAEAAGIGVEAMKKRLQRALARLRRQLGDRAGFSVLVLAAALQEHARSATEQATPNPHRLADIVQSLTPPTPGGATAIAKGASTMMLIHTIRSTTLAVALVLAGLAGAVALVGYVARAQPPAVTVAGEAAPAVVHVNEPKWSDVKTVFVHDDSAPADDCIDLDSADTTTKNQRVATREEGRAWWRESGADAHCETNSDPGENGLYGMGVAWVLVPNEVFDTAPADGIVTQLANENAADTWDNLAPVEGELPVTYAFKTKEGGIGLIQITAMNEADNKPGLSLHWKRVN